MHERTYSGSLVLDEIDDLANASHGAIADEICSQMALYTGHSGLEDFCFEGGAVDDVQVYPDTKTFRRNGNNLSGNYEISFQEQYYRGCPDIHWHNLFMGEGHFSLDLETGKLEVETTARHVPDWRDDPANDNPPDEPGANG